MGQLIPDNEPFEIERVQHEPITRSGDTIGVSPAGGLVVPFTLMTIDWWECAFRPEPDQPIVVVSVRRERGQWVWSSPTSADRTCDSPSEALLAAAEWVIGQLPSR